MNDKYEIGAKLISQLEEMKNRIGEFFLNGSQIKTGEEMLEEKKHFSNLDKIKNYFVWSLNCQDQFISVSPNVKEILGYESKDLLFKTIYDLLPENDRDTIIAELKFFRQSRKTLWTIKNNFKHNNGSFITLGMDALAIFDEDNQMQGYEGISYKIQE